MKKPLDLIYRIIRLDPVSERDYIKPLSLCYVIRCVPFGATTERVSL